MNYNNKPSTYYKVPRQEMLKFLPKNANRILEIGCGQGSFGALIKEYNNAEIWGIEYMPEEAEIAKSVFDKIFTGPCEDHISKLPDNYFDAIYCNDVLEHLTYPDEVLSNLKSKLTANGIIISSIPNIRNYKVLKMLLIDGNWDYAESGVMDKTHLRWFTKKSIKKMYINAGYKIISHKGINPTTSIRPYLYNIPLLFTAMDMRFNQFATVAQKI